MVQSRLLTSQGEE